MLNKHKNKGFTLIELLVVIAIIGILVAIILPSISRLKLTAQLARAHTEVRNIESAIMEYYTVYGRLPIPDPGTISVRAGRGVDTYHTIDASANTMNHATGQIDNHGSRDVINILTHTTQAGGQNVTLKAGTYWGVPKNSATADDANPRGTIFLESQRATTSLDDAGVYMDPWGKDYVMAFDANYTGKIEWFSGGNDENITKRVVVYSMGPKEGDIPPNNFLLPDPQYPHIVASHF